MQHIERGRHPHIGLVVMHEGRICRIVGVTRSARETRGGIAYHLMPDGCRSLKDIIQYVTTFDPHQPSDNVIPLRSA